MLSVEIELERKSGRVGKGRKADQERREELRFLMGVGRPRWGVGVGGERGRRARGGEERGR